MPDEDKIFSGSFVFDLRIWWRQVNTLYSKRHTRHHCKQSKNQFYLLLSLKHRLRSSHCQKENSTPQFYRKYHPEGLSYAI